MTGRCESCRFWREDSEISFRVQPGDRWGHCLAVPHDEHGPEAQATVVDYEGYGASLHTRPSFGCVLWRAARGSV